MYKTMSWDRSSCSVLGKKVAQVKRMYENTPSGVITDADTILADIMADADFEITGLGINLLSQWEESSKCSAAQKAFENLFYCLTDVQFEEYVGRCLTDTSKG